MNIPHLSMVKLSIFIFLLDMSIYEGLKRREEWKSVSIFAWTNKKWKAVLPPWSVFLIKCIEHSPSLYGEIGLNYLLTKDNCGLTWSIKQFIIFSFYLGGEDNIKRANWSINKMYAVVYQCGSNFWTPWQKINYYQSLSPIVIKLVLKCHLILYFSKLILTFKILFFIIWSKSPPLTKKWQKCSIFRLHWKKVSEIM